MDTGESRPRSKVPYARAVAGSSASPAPADVQVGTPALLFEPELASFLSRNRFVVTPDGQKFLLVTDADQTSSSNVIIVNWPSLLK